MPAWVGSLIGGAIGAVLAVSGAYLVNIILEQRRERRELNQYYSWIASLLTRLQQQRRADVRTELSAPTLHYTYNQLWGRIPEKVKFESKDLAVRELIMKFIKAGNALQQILDDSTFDDLRRWLAARSV